jgi:hypothetical protein
MPTTDPVYFHPASLRLRYIAAVKDALRDKRIDGEERTWLLSLIRSTAADDPDPVRVDRLTADIGPLRPFELSASLVLSHDHVGNGRVFLFSLEHGIEAFADRELLRRSLCTRFAGDDDSTVFEAEKVEGDPFKAQMYAIIDQQVDQLGQLTDQLRSTPTLYDAATTSMARQLRERFPKASIDPEVHLLQVVADSNTDDDLFPVTQTLAQTAFDECCNVQMTEGYKRRFLDVQGQLASVADSALFSRALTDATDGADEQYANLLEAFWKGSWGGKLSRRDLAVDAFSGSVRRELYRLWHDGDLDPNSARTLLPLLPSAPGNQTTNTLWRCSQMLLKIGASAHFPLAGSFVIQPTDGSDQSLFWFSPEHKLLSFTNLAVFTTFLESVEGRQQLKPALALQNQWDLLAEGQWHIKLREVRGSAAGDCVDSIIALQARNLLYVTGLPCAPEETMAMIDDALDVRQLLDPRQAQFSAGRWRKQTAFDFKEVWSRPEVQDSNPPRRPDSPSESTPASPSESDSDADIQEPLDTQWMEYAQAFDDRAERLRALDNVLFDYAEQSLQQYVCVLANDPVPVGEIQVQWLESAPVDTSDLETSVVPVSEGQRLVSIGLVALLLECVSGHRSQVLGASARVLVDSAVMPGHVGVELINHMLDKLVPTFIERYVQRFAASQGKCQRLGKLNLHPARDSQSLREEAICLDLALAIRQRKIGSVAIEMARQVMNRPQRTLRTALGVPLIEAFCVSLSYDERSQAMLCDALVLGQPLDQNEPLMLWQGAAGWRSFPSIEQLQDTLQRELHRTEAERWLNLLSTGDRILLHSHLIKESGNEVTVQLTKIEGHAIKALELNTLHRKQQDLRQLCLQARRCRFEAGLFRRLATQGEFDVLLSNLLDGLSVRIDNAIFEAMLPEWVELASVADLKRYYEIFTRLYLSTDGTRDFLFDIPSMRDYARERLVNQLSKDFPTQALNINQIKVIARRYVTGFLVPENPLTFVPAATEKRSESLVDYAINRFVDMQDAALSIESAQQPQAVSLLTPDYLRELVKKLDVGAGYVALLRKALTPGDADYTTRKRLFIQQLPATQLALALPEKVKGKISAQGYDFIASVFDMPDGIARESVGGVKVILSPLKLVFDEGVSPDLVAGVYLICPADPDTGPVLLYAIDHPPFTFREYSNQAALLDAISMDRSLQSLLFERLDPEVRSRYVHRASMESHVPFSPGLVYLPTRAPGPVTLKVEEVTGNSLHHLFTGTVKLLLDMGVSNSVTNEQSDHAGRVFLAKLVLGQALTLLPKRLAALVSLWQTHTLFQASAVSVSGHRWGEALSEFTAALGVMATAREQAVEDEQVGSESAPTITERESTSLTYSWRGTSLTVEQRIRLQQLEAQNVALTEMHHDAVLNVYRYTQNDTPYAVVAGKVYQIKRPDRDGKWMIVGPDGSSGPRISLDHNQRWQLELRMGLRGGGGVVSTAKASVALTVAERELLVEASGMPEIRQLYRPRARSIGQAHSQARRYLETGLDNLHAYGPNAALDPQVNRIIGEFFGTPSPSVALLTGIERAITNLLDALMDASLSPWSSPRFVVGTLRPSSDRSVAFVMPSDPRRRIFLTDLFFNVRRLPVTPAAAAQGFDQGVHYRAGTLIHELSHLVLDTKDIAYLDAPTPYPDLLQDNTAANLRNRLAIERLHNEGLSHRTPLSELFTVVENHVVRDLAPKDKAGFRAILRITGTDTLADARAVFLSDSVKRSEVMLKNADSLTLLILRLGRKSFVTPGSLPTGG